MVPDKLIVEIVGESCFQERLDVVEVDVAGGDRKIEPREVVEENISIATRAEITWGLKCFKC